MGTKNAHPIKQQGRKVLMVGMAFMPRPDLKCVMIQNVSIPIVLPEMQIGDFSECQKSIDLLFIWVT